MIELPHVTTRVGLAGFDDHSFRGFEVLGQLAGQESHASLLVLAATGRRLTDGDDVGLIDDVSVIMAMADPRIWPLKITWLVASYGSVVAGALAGSLCLEGAIVGPWNTQLAASLLLELRDVVGDVTDAAAEAAVAHHLAGRRRLPGFGVAFRPSDERLAGLRACVAHRGRSQRPSWRLAGLVERAVRRARGLEPNLALGLAALFLDLGFAPEEMGPLLVALLQYAFWANAVDAVREDAAVLRRLPDASVEYIGRPARGTGTGSGV